MFEPDELLLSLANARVEFIVIGGIAVGVHGFVRATKDLDIVPDPAAENLARLARVLVDICAQSAGVGEFSPEEFPYDPTDPVQLGEGANFRLETATALWTSCNGWLVSRQTSHIQSSHRRR
jgi:hypothetical protein